MSEEPKLAAEKPKADVVNVVNVVGKVATGKGAQGEVFSSKGEGEELLHGVTAVSIDDMGFNAEFLLLLGGYIRFIPISVASGWGG